MIKKQYNYYGGRADHNYFTKFVASVGPLHRLFEKQAVGQELKQWKATLGKSKASYIYNVKFHDPKLYTLFVMRWS